MPHLKNSLQINIQARSSLLAANGVFDKVGIITFDYGFYMCVLIILHDDSQAQLFDTADSDFILKKDNMYECCL